ncbi:MAG: DUF3179 domain-containing protein [Cyclobacteriaceae bacterium]
MRALYNFKGLFLLILIAGTMIGCGIDDDEPSGPTDVITNPVTTTGIDPNSWLVPQNEVFDGGPGKDGIPALIDPPKISVGAIDFMEPNDLIIGYQVGDKVVGYPHKILDWHEIINDEVDGEHFAVTYCPLTGTAIGYSRVIDGNLTSFGVSGLLYNTNLIPYDRLTDSNWSQILRKSVNGTLVGREIETLPLIETSWANWQRLYPNSTVVGTNTGTPRNYGRYPYGNYLTSPGLIFPISVTDTRLFAKERVLSVIVGENAKAYEIGRFDEPAIIEDAFDGLDYIVYIDGQSNAAVAFASTTLDGVSIVLSPYTGDNAGVMQDQFDNIYDLFGSVVEGPNAEHKLEAVEYIIGFWFTFPSFFETVDLDGGKN